MERGRKVSLWARDGLYVDAQLKNRGDLVFQGQDLRHGREYEYALTVRAADVPRVVAALDGNPGDDVLGLLAAHGEHIVGRGELTWLRGLGITPEFWSRGEIYPGPAAADVGGARGGS